MKGMGQIVSWSVRDESLHCDGISDLFRIYARETGVLTKGLKGELYDIAELVVNQEDVFVDLAFERGGVDGITTDEMKHYIRYMMDYRLKNLGLKSIFKSGRQHPLPWLTPLLSGVEHANFFETRATEYSKGATKGEWSEVWDHMDSRGYEIVS
jgi:ribonucleoside-diphosphate reductase beta chain